jgi:hypothetical protein
MSESHVPFSGPAAASAAPPVVESEVTGDPNRKRLLMLGGGAAVVLVAVLGYFLFFAGGGSKAPVSAAPAGTHVAQPTATPSATTAPVTSQRLNAKSFGRDPFKALIVDDASSAVGGAAATGATGTTTTTTTGSGTSGTSTGSTGTTAPVATASHSFRVVSVAPDNSTITVMVDGKRYNNLKAGEVFATYFKVLLISGTTNAFQYGDEKFNVLGTKRLTIA